MPTPEDIHPEFGYLAPKAPLRRNLRVGLIAGIVGLVLGGAAVMALAARSKPEVAKLEPTLAFASIDEVATAPAAASPEPVTDPIPASTTAGTPTGVTPPPGAAAKPCKEQTWPYLGSNCLTGTTHRWRRIRVLPPDAPTQTAPVKTADATVDGGNPPDPAGATPSKKRKSEYKSRHRRGREQDDAGTAYATPYEGRPDSRRRNEARQESGREESRRRDEGRNESRRRGESRDDPRRRDELRDEVRRRDEWQEGPRWRDEWREDARRRDEGRAEARGRDEWRDEPRRREERRAPGRGDNGWGW